MIKVAVLKSMWTLREVASNSEAQKSSHATGEVLISFKMTELESLR